MPMKEFQQLYSRPTGTGLVSNYTFAKSSQLNREVLEEQGLPGTSTSTTLSVPGTSVQVWNGEKEFRKKLKKIKINSDILDLFIDSYQPFSLVEERAFKKFARWIPGYELPSRKTVSNVLILNIY